VLVWGSIPGSAVVASIPLLQIIGRLPSYFLNPDTSDSKDAPLLGRLAWDYTRKKSSYRQFCQEMSDRFLRMPLEKRLRDTTAGSVRLALCLLRPHIHKHISGDFTSATTHVCDLSYIIAIWPGKWWVREHPEIKDLIRCMVHIVAEEMREAKRNQALTDATRMQDIVGGLEQLAQAYESRARSMKPMLPPPLRPMSASPTSTALPSPTDQESESWSTMSASTLSGMESKGIQTDPIPEPQVTAIIDSPPHSPQSPKPHEGTVVPSEGNSGSTFDAVAKTASCFFTCFFIGSFITLCMFSSHRRELANHLT